MVCGRNECYNKKMGRRYGHDSDAKTTSAITQASTPIDVLAQSRACVLVRMKLHGLIVTQQEQKLFNIHKLTCTNRVA